jgi:hypothetical protein
MCKRHATYFWKAFNEVYNFTLDITSIEGLHKKLWVSKMVEVSIFKILKFLIWKFQEKCHLGVTLMVNHKEYYKGKGDGFLRV